MSCDTVGTDSRKSCSSYARDASKAWRAAVEGRAEDSWLPSDELDEEGGPQVERGVHASVPRVPARWARGLGAHCRQRTQEKRQTVLGLRGDGGRDEHQGERRASTHLATQLGQELLQRRASLRVDDVETTWTVRCI